MPCSSCEMLRINGVPCHELHCPENWKVETECRECGTSFFPETRGMGTFCSPCCHAAYSGHECQCDGCESIRAEVHDAE